ncbi:faah-1, partial [Symbiodinium microadriaticum]
VTASAPGLERPGHAAAPLLLCRPLRHQAAGEAAQREVCLLDVAGWREATADWPRFWRGHHRCVQVLDRVGGVVCAATSAYSRCPAFLTCCKLLGPFDPALLHAHARGKLVGEAQVQPELDCHANGEGVLTSDIKNRQLWQTAGDLMSYRLGSPQVLCGLCSMAVPMRELSAHQSHQCRMVLSACPRCHKEVPIRELAAHQVGPDCLGTSSMGTQTLEKKVQDAPSQCSAPVLLPAGVQTGYALYAPENLRSEEPVPALVPSAAVRWTRPAPEARPREYQLSIFEFRGGAEWSRLRVELLEISSLEQQGLRGELRHELTHLRPGTKYRLELQPRAPDASLGPAAAVVLTTLSRLAGFEGFSAEDKATLEAVPQPLRAARPESISLREQSTQAGLGFVQGACKSEISREIGVQAFPTVLEEAACQVDPIIPVTQEIACGEEWASYTNTGTQCKAPTAETSVQSALQVGHSSCQAQFPPRPITGDRMAELEMDMQAALPGTRAVLHQVGTAELTRLCLAALANLLALASILLAEISLEELWPMLSVLLLVIPLNGLEFAFFEELAGAIACESVSAVQVLTAFRRRAEVIHSACNCVLCFVEESWQWAEEADKFLRETGNLLGPLHGVPCSIKDHVALKGHPVTMGLRSLREQQVAAMLPDGIREEKKPIGRSSTLANALRSAGAVIFCKTTMTQLGETWGGGSPAHGDTLNPWDTLRTSGGSSCGEGALLGAGGSPFGIGSDVGGSVRIPASFCGICALKPTAFRMTFNWETGQTILGHAGDYGVPATPGPMARHVEDLIEVCAAVWDTPYYDSDIRIPPLPFRREATEVKRPLRIGWYTHGYVYPEPCRSVVRAVEETRDALAAAGHTLLHVQPWEACSLADIIGCDIALERLTDTDGGLVVGAVPLSSGSNDSHPDHWTHPACQALVPKPGTKSTVHTTMPATNTPKRYQAAMATRDRLRDKFARFWKANELDLVLCPVFPFPPPPVEEVRKGSGRYIHTRIYNFLDYAAGVVPATHVTEEDLVQGYDPKTDDVPLAEMATRAVEGSLGLPVAVQLMFLPNRRAASKLRVWRRRNASLNRLIQLAALTVSDALRLYRAALQPGGPRFTGAMEPSQRGKTDQVQVAVLPSGDKTASAKSVSQAASSPDKWRSWLTPDELCGARCPLCSCTTPLPRMADLWRSTRFGLYCNVPQLAIALMLLLRQLQSSDTWGLATSLHVCALSAHGLGLLWILLRWIQLGCRRRAKHMKVAELTSDSIEKTLQLQWRGIEDVVCDAWFVVFYSFDKKDVLRVEMLPGRPSQGQWAEKTCLQLHDAPAGHFWVSVLCWHRGSLTMPLAMGHCDIPVVEAEPGPSRKRADVAEIATDAKPWEVVDAGTDPKDVIRPVAHAEVQNVPASVDAASQFPAVPVELCDASTTPEIASASERRVAKVGTSLGSFDLPVQLQCQEIASSEAGSKGAKGLWLTWLPHGLVEAAPRLVVHARRITATAGEDEPGEPGARVPAAMSLNQASFEHLEEGRYELVLGCELGACSAEVRRCPHDRCGRHVWAGNLEEHIRHCPWQPRQCPRAPVCSWQGCEDELQEHLHDCPGREIPCRHCGLGCWWVGPGKDEERHLEEDCEVQRLLNIVRPLNGLLSEACPDFRNPEVVRLQAKAVAYRRSVSAPGGPWREWKTPGRCFSCRKPVDRREQGLQSDSGEHRLCWSCLPKHVDWQHFRDNA